jgi:membrane protein YqaA with SNARE-associated domain
MFCVFLITFAHRKLIIFHIDDMANNKTHSMAERWRISHEWNKRTGLYSFMGRIVVKLLIIIALIVGVVLLLNHFFNLEQIIKDYIFEHDDAGVLTIFLISESFLGWIPPDLFIMWSDQFEKPVLWLTILGTISYIGGMNAYWIGKLALKFPKFRTWLESRNAEFFVRIRKWGGIIIILAALFPLPFATTTLAAGMVKYPLKQTLIFGLSRYIRFYLYGAMIFFGMDQLL